MFIFCYVYMVVPRDDNELCYFRSTAAQREHDIPTVIEWEVVDALIQGCQRWHVSSKTRFKGVRTTAVALKRPVPKCEPTFGGRQIVGVAHGGSEHKHGGRTPSSESIMESQFDTLDEIVVKGGLSDADCNALSQQLCDRFSSTKRLPSLVEWLVKRELEDGKNFSDGKTLSARTIFLLLNSEMAVKFGSKMLSDFVESKEHADTSTLVLQFFRVMVAGVDDMPVRILFTMHHGIGSRLKKNKSGLSPVALYFCKHIIMSLLTLESVLTAHPAHAHLLKTLSEEMSQLIQREELSTEDVKAIKTINIWYNRIIDEEEILIYERLIACSSPVEKVSDAEDRKFLRYIGQLNGAPLDAKVVSLHQSLHEKIKSNKWRKVKEGDDFSFYQMKEEGVDATASKIETELKLPLQEAASQWAKQMFNDKEDEKIMEYHEENRESGLLHTTVKVKFPTPFQNRIWSWYVDEQLSEKRLVRLIWNAPHSPVKGCVTGHMHLQGEIYEEVKPGTTRVTAVVHISSNGNVPGWVTNTNTKQFVTKFRKMALKSAEFGQLCARSACAGTQQTLSTRTWCIIHSTSTASTYLSADDMRPTQRTPSSANPRVDKTNPTMDKILESQFDVLDGIVTGDLSDADVESLSQKLCDRFSSTDRLAPLVTWLVKRELENEKDFSDGKSLSARTVFLLLNSEMAVKFGSKMLSDFVESKELADTSTLVFQFFRVLFAGVDDIPVQSRRVLFTMQNCIGSRMKGRNGLSPVALYFCRDVVANFLTLDPVLNAYPAHADVFINLSREMHQLIQREVMTKQDTASINQWYNRIIDEKEILTYERLIACSSAAERTSEAEDQKFIQYLEKFNGPPRNAELEALHQKLFDKINSDKWKKLFTKEAENFSYYQMKEEGVYALGSKIEAELRLPLKEAAAQWVKQMFNEKEDEKIMEYHKENDGSGLLHTTVKIRFPAFFQNRIWSWYVDEQLSDNKLIRLIWNAPHPAVKGCVVGHMHLQGEIYEEVKPGTTRVTAVVHISSNGNVPGWFVTKFRKMALKINETANTRIQPCCPNTLDFLFRACHRGLEQLEPSLSVSSVLVCIPVSSLILPERAECFLVLSARDRINFFRIPLFHCFSARFRIEIRAKYTFTAVFAWFFRPPLSERREVHSLDTKTGGGSLSIGGLCDIVEARTKHRGTFLICSVNNISCEDENSSVVSMASIDKRLRSKGLNLVAADQAAAHGRRPQRIFAKKSYSHQSNKEQVLSQETAIPHRRTMDDTFLLPEDDNWISEWLNQNIEPLDCKFDDTTEYEDEEDQIQCVRPNDIEASEDDETPQISILSVTPRPTLPGSGDDEGFTNDPTNLIDNVYKEEEMTTDIEVFQCWDKLILNIMGCQHFNLQLPRRITALYHNTMATVYITFTVLDFSLVFDHTVQVNHNGCLRLNRIKMPRYQDFVPSQASNRATMVNVDIEVVLGDGLYLSIHREITTAARAHRFPKRVKLARRR
ncbi:hypothetical protein PROFUN_11018 [Planoprotostelium fungivorum]|uniref:START domain-containing protein n=1 Tax=Planoprotostelium fungivorum TaxID=1890364 RepID=A0A2P6NBR5_9EUKA|nr:hypothetical protein PROFUN_11018 [Planoprotostelium fungivorum]